MSPTIVQTSPRRSPAWLTFAVAVLLALGILPSLTALSQNLAIHQPEIFRFTGPINPLKLGLPFLIAYLTLERNFFCIDHWRLSRALAVLALVGTLSTLIASLICGTVPALWREWFVILLGLIAAAAWIRLPASLRDRVTLFWGIALFGTVLLDFVWSNSVVWLLDTFFDPNTRFWDVREIGRPVVTGVFGRQSLAKLLAWMPWLFLAMAPPGRRKPLFALGIFSSGLILATSQRGPFLAALVGWAIYSLHQWVKNKDPRGAAWGSLALVSATGLMLLLVPSEILVTRWGTLVHGLPPQATREQRAASDNISFRKTMNRLSLSMIRTHPFGHACVSDAEFLAVGIPPGHAHNLFLEQFRSRGWLWGTLHLLLWGLAWFRAWSIRTTRGSFLAAGVSTVIVSGLFDHPWFVLNHAVTLWALVLMALLAERYAPRAEEKET